MRDGGARGRTGQPGPRSASLGWGGLPALVTQAGLVLYSTSIELRACTTPCPHTLTPWYAEKATRRASRATPRGRQAEASEARCALRCERAK
jgi:hypothetical protein